MRFSSKSEFTPYFGRVQNPRWAKAHFLARSRSRRVKPSKQWQNGEVKLRSTFACLMLFFLSQRVCAQQTFSFYQGSRQMMMGGAAVAVVNDETALLLNPAGLGRLRDTILTVLDPEVEAGSQTLSVLGGSPLNALNPQSLLDDLNKNPGQRVHAKAQVFPSFVAPNFGIGILGKYSVDASVDSTNSIFRLDYFNDYAFVMGFNLRFFGGILKLGSNLRVINRAQISQDLSPSSTNLSFSNLVSEGIGAASDLGVNVAMPWSWLPTVSAVVRDLGQTSYGLGRGLFTNSSVTPPATPQTFDVGVAVFPILGKQNRSTFTIEYSGIGTSGDAIRHLHAGAEINFLDAFFLRAGANQGYWTAGIELAQGNYQIQLGSYGAEVGTAPQRQEDRRYNAKFAYRF